MAKLIVRAFSILAIVVKLMMFNNDASAPDPFNLERFIIAQDPVFESVLCELRQGRKETHWMWFVFPQLKGLGRSWAADHFGIASNDEAKAYLEHPVLGKRLLECTALVNRIEGSSVQEMFGGTDALKFRSCMVLFADSARDPRVFTEALDKHFGGQPRAAGT